MTNQPKTRIPSPVYAVAGAGDLAYQRLRKLPDAATELREKAATALPELREKARTGATELRDKAATTLRAANATATTLREKAARREFDMERLRAAAVRNTATLVASAQAAQERAAAVYGRLVAHGERVIGNKATRATATVDPETTGAKGQSAAPAAVEAPDAPAAVAATPAEAPKDDA